MRHFEFVVIARHQLVLRSDDIASQIQGIALYREILHGFLLSRVDGNQGKRIEIPENRREIEFDGESDLFHSLRRRDDLQRTDGIGVGNLFPLRARRSLALHVNRDLFGERLQNPQGVGLVVLDHQIEGVRHSSLDIEPQQETVFLDVELGDDPGRWITLEPQGVDPGPGSHEGYVAETVGNALAVHYHLLGRFLTENVQHEIVLPGLAEKGVLRVVFHEFREAVPDYTLRDEGSVEKGYPVLVRIIHVVAVGIDKGIYAVGGVLNIPD